MKSHKIAPLHVVSPSNICEQLEQSGHVAKLGRYRRCCRGSRCGMDFCSTCDSISGQRLSGEVMEHVRRIEIDHRFLGYEVSELFDTLKVEFEHCLHSNGASKCDITTRIGRLLHIVKELKDVLDVSEVLWQLRQIKARLRERGIPDVGVYLRYALSALDSAFRRRLGYCFQAFTVTRRSGAGYRDLVVDTKHCVSELMGRIAAIGWGAVTHLHLQPTVHAHGVYWGPLLHQEDIACSWYDITGDSDHVEAKTLTRKRDIIKWVCYLGKSNAEGISLWLMTRGLRLLSRYGVFRARHDPMGDNLCKRS